MSKVALVLGGTGNVGSATVRAFLKSGCCSKVVATSRSQAKLDKLLNDVKSGVVADDAAKLVGVVGSPGTQAGAEDLKKKVIAAVGEKIDYVVSAMGFPWYKDVPLAITSRDKIIEVLDIVLFPCFESWKVFMPLIKNTGGSYVMVSGGGPDTFLGTGTSLMTICSSAETAFARLSMKETAQDGFTSTEVSFRAGIVPDPSVMPPVDGHSFLSSEEAGSALVSVALKKKSHVKTIVIANQDTLDKVIAGGCVEQ